MWDLEEVPSKKRTPVLGSPIPVLSMKVGHRKSIIWLILKISTIISMKRSRQELFIDMIILRGILL